MKNEPQGKGKTMKVCKSKCDYYFIFCVIIIMWNLLFMPQSMVTKYFNLGYSMFSISCLEIENKIWPNYLILADK